MKRHRLRAEDFTVGWICALSIESDAARAVLDEEYDDIEELAQYTLGRIGRHNVVIVYLPAGQIGTNSAAVAVAQMQYRFPAVKISLMVGIGGGVPSREADIRLGDVVISQPQGSYGGVVQYDFGKIVAGGQRCRTGFLNAPPPTILSAVAKLRSNLNAGRNDVQSHLSQIARIPTFNPHATGPDILFDPLYDHVGGATCEQCLHDRIIQRVPRAMGAVAVHYGTVASGNQVIKDGRTRDALSSELGGVQCFEMEAAGLMNHTPCLVIRGICDYADSHKNKKWQPFAAAAAAACAKAMLSFVPAVSTLPGGRTSELQEIGASRPHPDQSFLSANRERASSLNVLAPAADIDVTRRHPLSYHPPNQRKRYLDSLRFNQIDARHATIRTAHAKTCNWFINKNEYRLWLSTDHLPEHHGFLWIKGKPAAGKSTMMKYLLDETRRSMEDAVVISFFFNARGEELEKSTLGMYRSLLLQLLHKLPVLQNVFDLHRPPAVDEGGIPQWDLEFVRTLFQQAVMQLENQSVICFIDALDECDEDQIREMVNCFQYLGQYGTSRGKLWICFASRHYPHITIEKSITLVLEKQTEHRQDIAYYLQTELKAGRGQLVDQIEVEILERSKGIFLWVVLVVRILNKEYDRGRLHALRKRLDAIPDGLEKLFNDILARDNQYMEELVLCLQWLLYAKKPLEPEQLYYAILAGTSPETLSAWQHEVIDMEDMERFLLSASKGLAEVTKGMTKTVQFIHESVKDFLLSKNGLDSLHCGPINTFAARSHEELKRCCRNYLGIDVSIYASVTKHLPGAGHELRVKDYGELNRDFPFLEYAIDHVLYHADAAASHGCSQVAFIKVFPLAKWITVHNFYHQVHQRHSESASLLSVFIEKGLPNLIEIELNRFSPLELKGERYHYPLLAAMVDVNKRPEKAPPAPPETGNIDASMPAKDIVSYSDHNVDQASTETYELHKIDEPASSWAIQSSEPCLTDVLLNTRKASVNAREKAVTVYRSWSRAMEAGYENIIRLLSEQPWTNLNSFRLSGQTPLQMAAKRRHEGAIKLPWGQGGFDENATKMRTNVPTLSTAGKAGDEAMRCCLDGANALSAQLKERSSRYPLFQPEVEAQGDRTSARLVIEERALQFIEPLLVSVIEDPNTQNRNTGKSSSAGGAIGLSSVCPLLLVSDQVSPGAHVTFPATSKRQTFLPPDPRGIEELPEYQMQLNLLNIENEKLLMEAQYSTQFDCYLEIINSLLETRNVDLDGKDTRGRTAIITTVHSAVDELVKLLYMLRFPLKHIGCQDRFTLVPSALEKCAIQIAKLLLATGEGSPTSRDQIGGRIIGIALEKGLKKTAKLLSAVAQDHYSRYFS